MTSSEGLSGPGLHYRSNDPELPALNPLIRACEKAGIKVNQALMGVPVMNPDPQLVLVVGKAP